MTEQMMRGLWMELHCALICAALVGLSLGIAEIVGR